MQEGGHGWEKENHYFNETEYFDSRIDKLPSEGKWIF